MTDTVTSQNIDLSSWDILYSAYVIVKHGGKDVIFIRNIGRELGISMETARSEDNR
jgi:hypothetical protein